MDSRANQNRSEWVLWGLCSQFRIWINEFEHGRRGTDVEVDTQRPMKVGTTISLKINLWFSCWNIGNYKCTWLRALDISSRVVQKILNALCMKHPYAQCMPWLLVTDKKKHRKRHANAVLNTSTHDYKHKQNQQPKTPSTTSVKGMPRNTNIIFAGNVIWTFSRNYSHWRLGKR